jgi:hypothetical protein
VAGWQNRRGGAHGIWGRVFGWSVFANSSPLVAEFVACQEFVSISSGK